jgi:hypothetical protein
MREVFEDFIVVIKDARGERRGSMTPEEFRLASECPRNAFLGDCVERWNKLQEQRGYEDRASLEMRTRTKPRRSRRR